MMNMAVSATENKHYFQFDIIKFIAAILIVPVHYQEFTGLHNERFNFVGGWVPVANLVELFFILSGLFTAVQMERDKSVPFLRFLQKKVVRLWPMCALSVTVTALVGWTYRILTGQWFLNLPIGIWIYTKSVLLIFAGGGYMTAVR